MTYLPFVNPAQDVAELEQKRRGKAKLADLLREDGTDTSNPVVDKKKV